MHPSPSPGSDRIGNHGVNRTVTDALRRALTDSGEMDRWDAVNLGARDRACLSDALDAVTDLLNTVPPGRPILELTRANGLLRQVLDVLRNTHKRTSITQILLQPKQAHNAIIPFEEAAILPEVAFRVVLESGQPSVSWGSNHFSGVGRLTRKNLACGRIRA